jgi:hypothetical protein
MEAQATDRADAVSECPRHCVRRTPRPGTYIRAVRLLRPPVAIVGVLAAVTVTGGSLLEIAPVQAADAKGPRLTATPTRGLPPSGAEVTVRGRGYDPTVGVYVALCVTPKQGERPSPCGGGVNMTARDPSSAWVSSNPPPYGRTLATPYRRGGVFTLRLTVSALIGDVDCRVTSCSIVTRADHIRSGDRRFDRAVPVTFAAS